MDNESIATKVVLFVFCLRIFVRQAYKLFPRSLASGALKKNSDNPGQNVWDTLPFMPNSCNIRD